MATYIILNIIFIVLTLSLLRVPKRIVNKQWVIALFCLLILTFIFDNLMIMLGFFTYASDKILGLHIGVAPIEDFFYPVLAMIIIPHLWNLLGTKERQ